MRRPIEVRNAHFPGRAPIDSYGNGGFRFAGMSHRGSLLLLPSGIYGWDVEEGQALDAGLFARLFDEVEPIEFVLVGTGADIRPLPAPLRTAFRARGMNSDPMSTGAAVRTYNIMLAEERRVAAAVIAV
ncbi:hypothetical protein BJF92_21990 [Rhizobium rhizosphaerae]|uniref:NADH dehydrogenase [ubiquinone] 1 alpha subcomplex assembly factor 3 n=1 Tax=Xaviernesmea rhizosphaerae TaxID=1672749 RepID=A0A1Q9AIZ5_9HYPH|nr:Mth938-like domain-containing protein [Xaviernesmea rhizosphaerae]OLP55250.1 hypothetical protein BJF92_21990 [Xaviernesmea rhizosphaerae]OQP88054.1 hypothetical protein BTR14_00795 [Xaviernesmea rhizosphaerae]